MRKQLFTCMLGAAFLTTNPLFAMEKEGKDEKSLTSIKFAVIGDFGAKGEGNKQVSQLVKSWDPDFIITPGDNNYPRGDRYFLIYAP